MNDQLKTLATRTKSAKPVRRAFSDGHDGPFHIPADIIPPGMEYCWAREKIDGTEDENNMHKKLANGWEPVPGDRHAELSLSLNKKSVAEYVRRLGHILMERHKAIGDEEKAARREHNESQQNSVKWALDGGVSADGMFTEHDRVTRTASFQK